MRKIKSLILITILAKMVFVASVAFANAQSLRLQTAQQNGSLEAYIDDLTHVYFQDEAFQTLKDEILEIDRHFDTGRVFWPKNIRQAQATYQEDKYEFIEILYKKFNQWRLKRLQELLLLDSPEKQQRMANVLSDHIISRDVQALLYRLNPPNIRHEKMSPFFTHFKRNMDFVFDHICHRDLEVLYTFLEREPYKMFENKKIKSHTLMGLMFDIYGFEKGAHLLQLYFTYGKFALFGDKSWQIEEIKLLKNNLDKLPHHVLKHTTKKILRFQKPREPNVRGMYTRINGGTLFNFKIGRAEIAHTVSIYDSAFDKIVNYMGKGDIYYTDIDRIILHELGHSYDSFEEWSAFSLKEDWLFLSLWKRKKNKWEAGKKLNFTHWYAKTNPEDDWAESFYAYITDPFFKLYAPEKYQYMKKHVFGGIEYTPQSPETLKQMFKNVIKDLTHIVKNFHIGNYVNFRRMFIRVLTTLDGDEKADIQRLLEIQKDGFFRFFSDYEFLKRGQMMIWVDLALICYAQETHPSVFVELEKKGKITKENSLRAYLAWALYSKKRILQENALMAFSILSFRPEWVEDMRKFLNRFFNDHEEGRNKKFFKEMKVRITTRLMESEFPYPTQRLYANKEAPFMYIRNIYFLEF